MLHVELIKEWINSLPDDAEVGIDVGFFNRGPSLVTRDEQSLLEVGGIPVEDDPPAPHDACEDKGLVVDPIVMALLGPVGASIMTEDDRKKGLRAAAQAKLQPYIGMGVSAVQYANLVADLLWEIIDSLVDESATKGEPKNE